MKTVQELCVAMLGDLTSFATNDIDAITAAGRHLTTSLYDHKFCGGLNKLRVTLAAKKIRSLAKFPPCEASFHQHVKRAAWQARVWMNAAIAEPDNRSPLDHGWHLEDNKVMPTYFEGPMAAEMLKGLLCACSGKKACVENCACSEGACNVPNSVGVEVTHVATLSH